MMHACLHLDFHAASGATQLHCARQDPPWKVVRAFPNPAGESLVHINNISGGVFGGDHLNLRINLGPGTAAQITTTGATRLYRPREGTADALLCNEVHLGKGALLEYLPDSVIPFRDARCEQRTNVHLDSGATLFWWEIIAPGRVASGELFAYSSLRLNSSITSQGHPIYTDRVHFNPSQGDLSSLARLGKYRYHTSFMICRSNEDRATWIALEQMLREVSHARSRGNTLWGSTTLVADGVLVRGLSESGLYIMEDLFCFWSSAKSYLLGRLPSPPRRTY
ncbi:MAG: urease accessory protein UreD [Acidobacteriaceae bacterium]